jgi:hypothetical protein
VEFGRSLLDLGELAFDGERLGGLAEAELHVPAG